MSKREEFIKTLRDTFLPALDEWHHRPGLKASHGHKEQQMSNETPQPPNGYRLLEEKEEIPSKYRYMTWGTSEWSKLGSFSCSGAYYREVTHGWIAVPEPWVDPNVELPEGYEWATRGEAVGAKGKYRNNADNSLWVGVDVAEYALGPDACPMSAGMFLYAVPKKQAEEGIPFEKLQAEPIKKECVHCRKVEELSKMPYITPLGDSIHTECWNSLTRVERMLKGYEADVYKKHQRELGKVMPGRWRVENPRCNIPVSPDTRWCAPSGFIFSPNDRAPLAVQDGSGEDVAPDASVEDCKRLGAVDPGHRLDAIIHTHESISDWEHNLRLWFGMPVPFTLCPDGIEE